MKYFTIFVLFFLVSTPALACDVCGCAAPGGLSGILPQFQKKSFGLRYNFQQFNHPNTEKNFNGTNQVLHDEFKRVDAFYRLPLNKRFQLLSTVSFRSNKRVETGATTVLNGIGDPQMLLVYNLLNQTDSINRKMKFAIFLGGGARLPIAKYMQRDYTRTIMPAAFQLGSGAFGLVNTLQISAAYKTQGVFLDFQHAYAFENELEYQFGNYMMGSLNLYKNLKAKKLNFVLSSGLVVENFSLDKHYDQVVTSTGGRFLSANFRVDAYYKSWLINTSLQLPAVQQKYIATPANAFNFSVGIIRFLEKSNP